MRVLFIVAAVLLLFACTAEGPQETVAAEAKAVCSGDCVRGWFSPDGTTVAYTGPKYRGLSHYTLSDGTATVVSTAEGAGLAPVWPAVGAAAKIVAETTDNGVRVIPAPGAPARMLEPGSHSPRVSPDGRWVAFIKGNEIKVYDLAGGAVTRIAEGSQPAWMPDSRALIIAVTRDDGRDIIASQLFLVTLEGKRILVPTTPGTIPLYPDVSADGTKILYTEHATGRILMQALVLK